MHKYYLEFILNPYHASAEMIKNALAEFGENLGIADFEVFNSEDKSFKINICTEEPTVMFDICSQFGRISSIKINEEGS